MDNPREPEVTDDELVDDPLLEVEAAEGSLPAEPPEEAIRRLEGQYDALQDRYTRLAAEYDNFRKRNLREREELTDRVQGALVGRLLDELDDMDRLLAADPAAVTAASLYEGMELLSKKLWKELEGLGMERLDPVGVPFDPVLHEAVATTPATSPEQDHTVCRTFQVGYRFKGALLRPARVQVYADPGQA